MKKILITGAGGFIGGSLVQHFEQYSDTQIIAVDKKPISKWYQINNNTENLCLDLSINNNCKYICQNVNEIYNLAADMGGMGFIENFRIECMKNILINLYMLENAYLCGVKKFFYSSSACVYNTDLQKNPEITALKETDAYPALSERGYGWEKLFSEMLCQEYWFERNMKTFIARFHNVYGPYGSWKDGREKAPAAICRKIIEAKYNNKKEIEIWGDGTQTRSFQYIDDCVVGIEKIVQCEKLIATPINLGSSELVSINQLIDIISQIANYYPEKKYNLSAPKGVGGRNSDNTMIKDILNWEPNIKLIDGLRKTYKWIEREYVKNDNC